MPSVSQANFDVWEALILAQFLGHLVPLAGSSGRSAPVPSGPGGRGPFLVYKQFKLFLVATLSDFSKLT